MSQLKAEIISFGNELLIGRIINTNASYLAKKLTEEAVYVQRITTLSDEFEDLKQGFKEALQRQPDIIISTGGLGQTWDDRTAEGLALALDVPLKQHPEALKMVEKRYKEFNAPINPAGLKMADLPEGAIPLANPAGTAPGIRVQKEKIILYCIPGVPKEMQAIFETAILPEIHILKGENNFYQTEFVIEGVGESRLAHITETLHNQNPTIWLKSLVDTKNVSSRSRIIFSLTCYGDKQQEELLYTVTEQLKKLLVELGAELLEEKEKIS